VDARIGVNWLRFVNTHLEIQPFAPVQEAQVTELIGHLVDWLPPDGAVNNSGPTCCQASDLSSRASQLDQRLDLILARNVAY